ncbi:hypothetical protein AN191_16335 [Loktanella sp. 5RATIMAR09]|nr:hypothetical protein AN191_16335 [Loktanella sp. 5RATIMAR09]
MSSLSIGLFGLSCAFFWRSWMQERMGQTLWVLCGCAALAVFMIAPRPFVEVTLWAGGAAMLWLFDQTDTKSDLVFAGIAGFLIGASAPYLQFGLNGVFVVPVGTGVALAIVIALIAGLMLAHVSGAAMAIAAAALPTGLFVSTVIGVGILLAAMIAVKCGQVQPLKATVLLLLVPVVNFFGGVN